MQSATVNIKLTEEEKSALTTPLPDGFELESWQEETVESDGDDTTTVIESAPEGIPAAGGEGSVSNNGNTTSELPATTAAQPTDYRLSFKLTQGVPITNVTVLTVAEDITIEITDADIEITDATYTEGQKNTAPSFKMEPSPFEFSLPEQEEEPKDEGSEKEEGNGQNGQDTSCLLYTSRRLPFTDRDQTRVAQRYGAVSGADLLTAGALDRGARTGRQARRPAYDHRTRPRASG